MALSFSHFLNDTIQSLVPAIYPMLKGSYGLSFAQVGLITLTMQVTSSVMQPVVGYFADSKPQPYSLPIGMGATLIGLLLLAHAGSFHALILGRDAGRQRLGGVPPGSLAGRAVRVGRAARPGAIAVPGRRQYRLGDRADPRRLYRDPARAGQRRLVFQRGARGDDRAVRGRQLVPARAPTIAGAAPHGACRAAFHLSRRQVFWSLAILFSLVFSKAFYQTSIGTYYTFYLMSKFHLTIGQAQIYLFAFLGSVAVGTFVGGLIGDRIGRKKVIWGSIWGVIPFTLALPHVGLLWTAIFSVVIGATMASASSAIIVYGIDLVRGTSHDRRAVFWPVVRPRRDRRGAARAAGRRYQHQFRLPSLRLPAADRPVDRAAAGHRPAEPTQPFGAARKRRTPDGVLML